MFKGESDLDVFQSSNALKMLVETFSDVKDFEAYFSFMEYSTKMAEQAQTNAQKSDRKNSEKIAQLKRTIEQESNTLEDIENEIRNIMIKAVKTGSPDSPAAHKAQAQYEALRDFYHVKPTIEKLQPKH